MFVAAFLIVLIPFIIFITIGRDNLKKNEKDTALIYFILAGIYLIVGIGVCSNMI